MGLLPYRLALLLSTRSLVLQGEVPKSGPWKGFLGAPAAAKAAVGYLEAVVKVLHGQLCGPGQPLHQQS
jgi:hypothetical protein